MQLNAKTVAGLTPDKKDVIIFDEDLPGFGCRLRQRDGRVRRSWIVQYRVRGRTRRVKLGTLETLTASEARKAARQLLGRVSLGEDPQGEKATRRRQVEHSFRAAVDTYLAAREGELRPSSFKVSRLYLTGPYFKTLHGMAVTEIAHPDIAAALSAITRAHGANTARGARSALSAAFKWFMEEGWVTANPVIGTRQPADPTARERVLEDAELVAVWRACAGDDDYFRIIRLLILTGCRRQEIGGMCWDEFDDRGCWTLPGARSKNHRPHTITLPPAALEIVKSVPHHTNGFLLGDRGFRSWSRGKDALDRRLAGDVRPWRVHDLRRTVASGMIDLGIEPHHVEATLNHFSGHRRGVAGIYNRSPYERQIKEALVRWSEHVAELVEGRRRRAA
jgi:integrase